MIDVDGLLKGEYMTKRAYYTDPLYAAIACRDFGMHLVDVDGQSVSFTHDFDGFVSGGGFSDKAFVPSDLYILLTPRVGDYGGDGKMSGTVVLLHSDRVVINTKPWNKNAEYGMDIKEFIIEKRHGKFFPWPEWE